jgi:hypothetical protein
MALTSPGVEVTIIDESQYIPAATNSVPYVLLATAQNKVSGAGVGVAAGTLKVNANRTYLITSQRDLSATFGVPFFYKTTAGTPINGYELNEYGLLAAYSALGVSNRCYVQRVDIDLAALTATLVRPTGNPPDGTYWLDTASTTWGIFEWNQTTSAFTNKVPLVITDATQLEGDTTVPLQSIGSIGDYAVVTTNVWNPGYYKRGGPTSAQAPNWLQDGLTADELYNTWVFVGSDEWKTSWPTIQGVTAPVSLTAGNSFSLNDVVITVPTYPNNTVLGVATAINQAMANLGVYAAAIGGKLSIYADSTASNDGSTVNGTGIVAINNVSGTPVNVLGMAPGQYLAPAYLDAPSYQAPRWRTTDTDPEPTGSVWQKTNNVNLGANFVMKKYSATLGTFVEQSCPVYANDNAALYALDPSGGGRNIPAGATYAHVNADNSVTSTFEIFERYATGATVITGEISNPEFTSGDTFYINATYAGSPYFTTLVEAEVLGTTAADFCAAVSAAAVPYVSATVNSAGAIVFTHSQGGDIGLINNTGTPVSDAGFHAYVSPTNIGTRGVKTRYQNGTATGLLLSNWVGVPTFTYTANSVAPDQDPDDGTLWYYSATDVADIMIQNDGEWMGYQNVTNDTRGDDLSTTNATGPIFSTTAPLTQTDESQSPLVTGDLWIDTSDLENYPLINRWTLVNGAAQWVRIDNTDSTTSNGIVFADARWSSTGTVDPVTGAFPTITSLLTSDYTDIDAPSPSLYPQGTLLWNTRRSGFQVKTFEVNYFNSTSFNIDQYSSTTSYVVNDFVLYNEDIYVCIANTYANAPSNTTYWSPIVTNTWVTTSGNKIDGAPYMGRQSQRALIVAALKSGIDTSTQAREEQRIFNLVACPQYPELTPNLVALNNERNNTAFVVADTPLRLTPDEILTWATNNSGLGLPAQDGLTTGSVYTGVFYPSCQTTDLSGSVVVQPPSHMMLRTIIRSDEVAYPWLAPAGTRRGVIDNANQIGYINSLTGEFISLGVRQGLRDVLYENRINPITFVPGVGITNFGNKTVTTLTSALDRINVARLVAFIRGRLEVIAKQFLFEPNDQITRNEITNAITSMMIDLVAKRGIYDYLVVCDLTNNTPARIDRNELYVDIAIEPVKAVEFIYIPVRIKNTGEIASQSV